MALHDILPKDGRFYKANLHCHSTCSDGALTPKQLKEAYTAHGYSVLAYTDHNCMHNWNELSDAGFLALNGIELNVNNDCTAKARQGFTQTCHLCAIARSPQPPSPVPSPQEYSGACVTQAIQRLHRENFIVHYNHPAWSQETPQEFLQYCGFDGFEIYNHGSAVLSNNGDNQNEYAAVLRSGARAKCIAADDNHNWDADPARGACEPDAFGGWVIFKAKALTYGAIIQAYDENAFYASTGPEIFSYYRRDDILVVDCSPVQRAFVMDQDIGPRAYRYDAAGNLTHLEFDLKECAAGSRYLLLQLVDTGGKKAWTNPYYL